MHRQLLYAILILLLFSSCGNEPATDHVSPRHKLEEKHGPADYFFLQRGVPGSAFNLKSYTRGLREARQQAQSKGHGFNAPWTVRGPGNLGARVNAVAVHPSDENIIYLGFSAGGVFKTTDGGETWNPIFDDQLFLAIGDITLDPQNPGVVYVGTGDPNISGYPFIGDGLYRSPDGGQTWQHLGLTDQRIISRILVDPTNTEVLYVACMGLPFERNTKRGLYKSVDGGLSWEQVLFVSDQSGIIDLVMDPSDPQVLYAAAWDRIRNNIESTVNGPNARIFKTTNGGQDWVQLVNGLPDIELGRIGLAISQTNPQKLFAMYIGTDQQLFGLFVTEDAGDTWSEVVTADNLNGLSPSVFGGFGWFFGQFRVNPIDDDNLFMLGVDLWASSDGGQTWDMAGPPWWSYEVHADKHDLVFTPSGKIILATDGGAYRSEDGGMTWEDIENIPTTQFYRVAYNPHLPDRYYGGAQDNGSTGGATLEDEWERILGGDGFQMAFNPDFPGIFYGESQYGNISYTDSGGDFFLSATNGIDFNDRRSWDMPYFISSHDPFVLYTGTFRVYKSASGEAEPLWVPISEDLTDGIVTEARNHNITTVHESPQQAGLLYVGTSDANVWRTDDDGETWVNISDGLPERYVTDIKASPDFPDWVYVVHSGYKDNDFSPRIYRSSDRGANWEGLEGNLPDLAINDVYVLPGHQDTVMFVATDGGVYGSRDAGQSWSRLGSNMPYIAVYDLEWNQANHELVAGTFARSIMSYPLDSLLAEEPQDTMTTRVPVDPLAASVRLFPNPVSERLRVEFTEVQPRSGNLTIGIFTADGRLRQRIEQVSTEVVELNVADWPAGIYFLKMQAGDRRFSRSFVKR